MKDSIDNELSVGDKVQLVLPSPHVIGYIHSISDGGVIRGLRRGGQDVQPALLTIVASFQIPIDPTQAVAFSVTKVHDAAKDASVPVLKPN